MTDDDEFACSHCGAMLPGNVNFCRHCGASDEYGWDKEDAWSETHPADDEAGYGQDDFDYDDYIAREFPGHADPSHARRRSNNGAFWLMVAVCVGIVLTAVFAAMSGRLF